MVDMDRIPRSMIARGLGLCTARPGSQRGSRGLVPKYHIEKKNRQDVVPLYFMIIRSTYRAMKGAAATPVDNATRRPKRVEDFIVELLFC